MLYAETVLRHSSPTHTRVAPARACAARLLLHGGACLALQRCQPCMHFVAAGIRGTASRAPYKLDNGKETSTWLLLQHGTAQKYMPLTLVSNSKFEEVLCYPSLLQGAYSPLLLMVASHAPSTPAACICPCSAMQCISRA